MTTRSFTIPLLLLLCCLPAFAQRRGSNPHNRVLSDLRVRVVTENDRPLSIQVLVTLQTSGGATIGSEYTRDAGNVEFRQLAAGNYRIRVTAPSVEEATLDFSLTSDEGTHQETVRVKMLKGETEANSDGPGGTVAAIRLNIPPKAQKDYSKGVEDLNQRKFDAAEKRFRKAIEEYPQYDLAYHGLGVAFARTGQYDAARNAFDKAVQLNQHFTAAFIDLARLDITDKNYHDAEMLLAKALTTEPLNPDGLFLISYTELLNGEFDQAVNNARKLHALPHESLPMVHYVAALALQSEHRSAEAITEYKTFMKESPPNTPNLERAKLAVTELEKQPH